MSLHYCFNEENILYNILRPGLITKWGVEQSRSGRPYICNALICITLANQAAEPGLVGQGCGAGFLGDTGAQQVAQEIVKMNVTFL